MTVQFKLNRMNHNRIEFSSSPCFEILSKYLTLWLPNEEIDSQYMNKTEQQTSLDRALAKPMFVLTLVWLGIAGVAMHLLGDREGRYFNVASGCGIVILVLWLAYFVEVVARWRSGEKQLRQHIKICLFPPLRLGGRDHVHGKTVWIPVMGWRTVSDELAEEIDIKLSYAMIAIALLVLPLLAIEFFYFDKIAEVRAFGLAIQLAQAFIWFAFAAEFMLMISLVSKRILFVKNHWLDLAIICLPMIAFMRVFRLGSAARLGRLSKTARVFRLRGLAMRAWRAVLILEIVDRLIHRDPEKRLGSLEKQVSEKREEIDALEAEIMVLEQRLAANGKSVDTPSTG